MLPHAFPFRLVEGGRADRVDVRVTGDAAIMRGEPTASPALAVEILAQAALLLLGEQAGGEAGAGAVYLAGVDGAECPAPLVAGERLAAGARIVGRFGGMVKVEAWLEREAGAEAGPVARAGLLLVVPRG
jgi:hypothetical protein